MLLPNRSAACLAAWLAFSWPVVSLGQALQPPGVNIAPETLAQWGAALESAGWKQGPYLNALALERSPYLLQHASNPVNWVAWSETSLARAAAGEQLIFLSIGYSTCHWCHVMNRESFTNPQIAQLINEHFVAIKVDREEMPAVDQYYSGVLAMVKGSAGWPLTAILDSGGKPIFIESYLEPAALQALLERVIKMSAEQPTLLEQSARFLAAATASAQQPADAAESAPLTRAELQAITSSVLSKVDPVDGGLAGAQKFPNEAALAFLSAMRQRQLDGDLAAVIERQLGNMATRGLYDHVQGGFFRYATDPAWTVPHYEKMLYNQALLLQAYSNAYAATGLELYRWLIKDLENFLQRWMRDDAANTYFSAISADTGDEEGVFYLWSAQSLQQLPLELREAAALTAYPGPTQTGLQGIMVGEPDSAAAAQIRQSLRALAEQRERPFVDRKVITAWNAALLSGLVAARQSLESDFGSVSTTALEAMAEHAWNKLYAVKEGVLYRVLYDGQRQVPGVLADYAYLAKALVDMYDLGGKRLWLERAGVLAEHILAHFQQAGVFTLVDSRETGGGPPQLGAIADGEMPAADAVALQAMWRLAARLGDARLQRELALPVAQLREKFRQRPLANLYAAAVLAEIDLGSVASLQYFAGGNGRMIARQQAEQGGCMEPVVEIQLAPGWHVNSQAPLQDYLIPTRVAIHPGLDAARIDYPQAKRVTLSFDDEPLSVYEGTFRVAITTAPGTHCQPASGAELTIDLQACTDQVCMPPETLTVLLPD